MPWNSSLGNSRGPRIVSLPRRRDTALSVPFLHQSSAHNPSIHVSWPREYLSRRVSLCTHNIHKTREFQRISKRFQDDGLHLQTLTLPSAPKKPRGTEQPLGSVSKLWLLFPFHPALVTSGFSKAFARFWNRDTTQSLLRNTLPGSTCGLAWRNHFPNIGATLERTTNVV